MGLGQDGPVVLAVEPGEGAADVSRVPRLIIQLDRPLAPRGLPVESVLLVSGANRFPMRFTSDPTRGTLEAVSRTTLPPNTDFRLELEGLLDVEGGASFATTHRFRTGPDRTPDAIPAAGWAAAALVLERCVECHSGAAAPLGLDLSSAEAIAGTALGVPAREVAVADPVPAGGGLWGLARIEPGAPGSSYLIWKLTGDPHVPGAAMPPGDPLSDEDIQTLVAWVRNGAPLIEGEPK